LSNDFDRMIRMKGDKTKGLAGLSEGGRAPLMSSVKKQWPYLAAVVVLFLLPMVMSDFRLNLLGKFLAFAIVALGIDLIWGYTGILSLGHGVFFSLGAYCMAMYMKLQGESLPDFMMWSGLTDLPWFWKPFAHLWFALPMVVIVPVIVAVIVGIPTFRARIKGSYFAILTQALALVFSILFIGQQPYTGGTNGITNFQEIMGQSLSDPSTMKILYFITAAVLVLTFIFCKWLVNTKMGRILIAIRDGENRLRFLGYNATLFKILVYALSAALAGIAGALYVPQVGIISPSMMGILPSVEMAIWVAVGGRGTLIGGVIGALVVNFAKTYLSEAFPDIWLYFQGALFVGVVLLFPNGIVGIFETLKRRRGVKGAEEIVAGLQET
jgi:urea transport system permease protein